MKIPRLDSQTQIPEKPLEPTQNPSVAGAPYRAAAELIGKTTDIVTALGEKRYRAQANFQSSEAKAKYMTDVNELKKSLDTQFMDTDPSEYMPKFKEGLKSIHENTASSLSNSVAREDFAQYSIMANAQYTATADAEAGKKSAMFFATETQKTRDTSIKNATNDLDFDAANVGLISDLDNLSKNKGVLYSDEQFQSLKKNSSDWAKNPINMAIAKGEKLNDVELILSGKSAKHQALYDSLSSDDLVLLKSRLTAAKEERTSKDDKVIAEKVRNVTTAMSTGTINGDAEVPAVEAAILASSLKPELKEMYTTALATAKISSNLKRKIAASPMTQEQLALEIKELTKDIPNDKYQRDAAISALTKNTEEIRSEVRSEMAENPAKKLAETNMAVRDSIAGSLDSPEGWENYKAITNFSWGAHLAEMISPNGSPEEKDAIRQNATVPSFSNPLLEEKGKILNGLGNAGDFAQLSAQVTALEVAVGPDLKQVLKDMKVGENYAVLANVDTAMRPMAAMLLHNAKDLDNKMETTFEAERADLRNTPEYQSFANTPEGLVDAEANLTLVALYQRQLNSRKDSTTKAWDLVTSKYAKVQLGSGPDLLVPKEFVSDPRRMSKTLRALSSDITPEGLAILGINVPAGQTGGVINQIQGQASWVADNASKKFRLVIRNTDQFVPDSKGRPISISFDKAQQLNKLYKDRDYKEMVRKQKERRDYGIGQRGTGQAF